MNRIVVKKIFLCAIIMLMTHIVMRSQTVTFSHSGGFYEDSFDLELTCDEGYQIRYTTNGATPTAGSTLYEEPLHLDANLYSKSDIYTIIISPESLIHVPDSVRHAIVIRAAAFDNGGVCVSDTVTNTYLIRSLGCDSDGMAVVSICADSLDLFDYNHGIFVPGVKWNPANPDLTGNYYQHGQEWERRANVEFYEPDDNSGINQCCGLRTHGNRSRRYPSKGMKIYARDEYGKKRFKHEFFGDSYTNSFKHLVLKPFASFWPFSGAQDYICNKLALQVGLTSSNCRPIVVYINGEYWGLYFIQEKMDERFLEDHFGINPEECNIIGNWHGEVEHGTNTSFQQMMSWFANADLTNSAEYEHACDLIDINSFLDYYVFQTFIGNFDWPGNNMRCWQLVGGRWQWIFFDGDAAIIEHDFDVMENAAVYEPPTTWSNYPEAKLLFGKLLKNEQFREAFKARAREWCNGPFMSNNTLRIYNDVVETMRPKISDQSHRFGYPASESAWNTGNAYIHDFLEQRVEDYLDIIASSPLLDIDELMLGHDKFACFPNPTTGEFWVQKFENSPSDAEIRIYNVTGILVFEKSVSLDAGENIISLNPHLQAGVYFIKIGNLTQRIVIQ